MRITFTAFLIVLLSGCVPTHEEMEVYYLEGKQVVRHFHKEEVKIWLKSPKEIIYDKEGVKEWYKAQVVKLGDTVRIGLTANPSYSVKRAYFGCNIKDSLLIDTATHRVNGCGYQLLVQNDTVKISLAPARRDTFRFQDILMVLQGPEEQLHYADTSFYFVVN